MPGPALAQPLQQTCYRVVVLETVAQKQRICHPWLVQATGWGLALQGKTFALVPEQETC